VLDHVDTAEIRPRAPFVLRAFLNPNDIVPLVDPDDLKKFSISIPRLFPTPLPRKESPVPRGGSFGYTRQEAIPHPGTRDGENSSQLAWSWNREINLSQTTRSNLPAIPSELCKAPRQFKFLETGLPSLRRELQRASGSLFLDRS
jgi:hypothetical protein